MIEALTPNGTNYPLHVGSLPRRSRRGQHFVDAHVSHLFSELIAEDSIAVAQQVTRELVEGKGLPQLLSCPLRGGVGSHIEVKNATPAVRCNCVRSRFVAPLRLHQNKKFGSVPQKVADELLDYQKRNVRSELIGHW